MSLKTVSADLKSYFQTNFTALNGRVFLLASEASYLLMSSYDTPGMGIVYTGGNPDVYEQAQHQSEKYTFDIFLYQVVWKEEKVIEGDGTEKGLLELRTTCKKLIEDIDLNRDFTDKVYLAAISGYTGTSEWPELNADGLAAWIGMSVIIKEQ